MAIKFDKTAFIGRFKDEAHEHLSSLEKDILSLEKNTRDDKLIEEMMRQAHTLKGAATMMGYKRIAELSHTFEDALLKIKEGAIKVEHAHFDLLLEILDSINSLLEDKLTWPDKGIAYPYLLELEKKINKGFGLAGEKIEAAEKPELKTSEGKSPQAGQAIATEAPKESVRVGVEKLNQILNLVGELVAGKIRVEQRKKELDNLLEKSKDLNSKLSRIKEREVLLKLSAELQQEFSHTIEEFAWTSEELGLVTSRLRESVMGARMLPLETIFHNFPRLVRDLSREEKKLTEFNITGAETELDKTVIERVQDPLMHILRNAVNHGIELPEEREKIGKPAQARIDLRAYYVGSQVVIEVEDDGRGIDPHKVKEMAVKKGILPEAKVSEMPDNQALYLLFNSGMSTQEEVSQTSGRGVGLNVVKTNVAQLKGGVEVNSRFGKGTKFTIKLPLTLAVALALFVRAGNETFALDLENVREIARIKEEEIRTAERREAISRGDEIIPLIRLGAVLGLAAAQDEQKKEDLLVVIVSAEEMKLAILVDELKGSSEIVVKNLGDHLKKTRHIAGSTILGTGEVILILDIPSLVLGASSLSGVAREPARPEGELPQAEHTVLLVDDSAITRDLEKSILEAAGYRIGLAKNGREALEKLSKEKFDLVLTDITMPEMDGIEMLKCMRQDERFSGIPVVVVSAKDSEKDRKMGLEAGASAYLVKTQFDQVNLLDTIERLIG